MQDKSVKAWSFLRFQQQNVSTCMHKLNKFNNFMSLTQSRVFFENYHDVTVYGCVVEFRAWPLNSSLTVHATQSRSGSSPFAAHTQSQLSERASYLLGEILKRRFNAVSHSKVPSANFTSLRVNAAAYARVRASTCLHAWITDGEMRSAGLSSRKDGV